MSKEKVTVTQIRVVNVRQNAVRSYAYLIDTVYILVCIDAGLLM